MLVVITGLWVLAMDCR
uniref:Uncharacterized protein n=1 Tax=Arundo donax TaxID=35708 RepID=A0A0A9C2P1_ARUDO